MYNIIDRYRIALVGVCVAVVVAAITFLVMTLLQSEEPVIEAPLVGGQSAEYTACVDKAALSLESIGVPSRQAIDQAETSPRCLPLRK